jgi:hypothetical protein
MTAREAVHLRNRLFCRTRFHWVRRCKFKRIAFLCKTRLNGANRKFQYRMSTQACGDAPWPYSAPNLPHSVFPIQIDQIDWKLHEERVDGFAWNNPKPSAAIESIATEQPLGAFASTVRHFKPRGKHRSSLGICHLEKSIHISRRLRGPSASQHLLSRVQSI